MGRGALAAAWVLSIVPGALSSLGPELQLGLGSHLGWALVPWIALAGLPAWGSAEGRSSPAVTCALALPPLALAARIDHAAGADLGGLIPLALAGLGMMVLLALASARGSRGSRLHGLLWVGLVPGTALASWSLGLAGEVPGWLQLLGSCSPLSWALTSAAAPSLVWPATLGALAVASLCLLASAGGRRP